MQTKRPIIGITSGEIHNRIEQWSPLAYGQSQTYIDAVVTAGGTPMLLPLTTDRAVIDQLSSLLDGLLLAGGNDLNPALYNQQPLQTTTDYSDLRDTTEQMLLQHALERNTPILAICRGMQLVNVHFGGTIIQHLTSENSILDHDGSTKLKTLLDLSHTLTLQNGSRIADIVGAEPIGANAHHHQAIGQLGEGVQAVGWAADDIIEAIEVPGVPYCVGIQAHPESLTIVEPRWAQLFSSFVVAACGKA